MSTPTEAVAPAKKPFAGTAKFLRLHAHNYRVRYAVTLPLSRSEGTATIELSACLDEETALDTLQFALARRALARLVWSEIRQDALKPIAGGGD